jgi:hypothetical protein
MRTTAGRDAGGVVSDMVDRRDVSITNSTRAIVGSLYPRPNEGI